MTIQEMIARQQAIVSGARAAGRDLTAEERAEFDGLQRQIDAAGNNPAQGAEGQGGEDPTGGARGMGNDNGQQGTAPTEAARQAVATERQRVSDITALCRQAGMDPAEYISNGATMDTVRQAAVDYLLKHGAPVSSRMNGDSGDNFRQAAADAEEAAREANAWKERAFLRDCGDDPSYCMSERARTLAGMAGADNPRYAVTVVMKDPNGVFGGLTAGPVSAQICEFLMQKYEVPVSSPRKNAIPVTW